MFFRLKNHTNFYLLPIFIILIACQLQEPTKVHGIIFLENRAKKLTIDQSNKNDVIQIIGQPHAKSIANENEWIYIERVFTKGNYHKLGRNVLKSNNVLVLNFDRYGILKQKLLIDKENKNKVKFSKSITENEITQKSAVEKFLSSIKEKMYSNRKK
jgi:outer membrane protein assembly factor BamE (lipoprotein component of BamABCDE complex)|tara:strand:+ start:839 stop:1309 length:471 start_codon:yes stop_codon:yes gene_type:complete